MTSSQKAINDIIGYIDNMPAADVEPDESWIRVDDRLPEEDVEVLIYGDTGLMSVAYMLDNRWITRVLLINRITHWMPLPKKPKEEEKK